MSNSTANSTLPTLVDILRRRAREEPDKICFTYLKDGTTKTATLTYYELDQQARAIAAAALAAQSTPGDRALLMYPPGLAFISAFFGCLYAGLIAVIAYPPGRNYKAWRLHRILASAEPTTILSTASVIGRIPVEDGIRYLATDEVSAGQASVWNEPQIGPDSLAFLQYTSGSTSTPKGVMVSHQNIVHNSKCINEAFELTSDTISVTWLPSYHDMGLIDGIIQPIFGGFPAFLMAPASFLQQPLRWLEVISEYRATHSGGPNFAYDLCVSKTTPSQREGLDLSSWVAAYNGAEPVRADTMRRFTQAFQSCGFRSRFFYPCYGLAEATLMVTGGLIAEEPIEYCAQAADLEQHSLIESTSPGERARVLVGCGRVTADTTIVIVDPQSRTCCAPDQVGEIWISGQSVAGGYWHEPKESERVFHARLAGNDARQFLRTGDLGFLRDQQLFVTGRLKDMFIVRGRNYYPQDLELTAEQSHPAIRSGCGAAFTVSTEAAEKLIIVYEVGRVYLARLDVEVAAAAIRQAIAEEHEIQVEGVVFLRPATIPKTSSGKIQRHQCRDAFLAGTLKEVGRCMLQPGDSQQIPGIVSVSMLLTLTPENRRQQLFDYLRQAVSHVLRISAERLGPKRSLLQLGLDSFGATELKHRLEEDLNLVGPAATFLQNASLDELVHEVSARLDASLGEKSKPLISSSDKEGDYPMSRGQEALWFLQQMVPDNESYNVFFAMRILSELDVGALKDALQKLSDRHAALRTTIAMVGGQPRQRIHPRIEVEFNEVDATLWGKEEVDRDLIESSHRPFDLETGPLFRTRLYHLGKNAHILLFTAHHIVTDFWSAGILLEELSTTYAALRRGNPVRFAPLSRQAADHASWQADLISSSIGEKQLTYWRRQLPDRQFTLNIPTDRPRPAIPSFLGATIAFQWDRELATELRTTAKTQDVTLYVLLLASFLVQLSRLSGQQNISVGVSVDGRARADFAGTVGYLVNQLVVRADLSGNPGFEGFLRQLKQTVRSGFENQDVPFGLVVEHLKPERSDRTSPFFQVMFVLQKAHGLHHVTSLLSSIPGAAMDLGDLRVESVPLERRAAQFEITLTIVDTEDTVSACWEYNRDLFDCSTITRMNSQLQTLLREVVRDPGRSIETLPLLSAQERERILVKWNQTEAPYPKERCVHELFEAAAISNPDEVALTYGKQCLSYRELDDRANRLAHYLLRLGIGVESLVGVCIERSIELVVAILGIMKAGAAYVPLDPAQPAERLAYMIQDAKLAVLLTQQSLLAKLPVTAAKPLCLDSDWTEISASDHKKPLTAVVPDNLAYVIYTSGSTGSPKGVMITHRGFANYLSWSAREYNISTGTGAPVNTSIGFDATATSLFLPLIAGKKVVLLSENQETMALVDSLLSGEDFSLIKITPPHLELLKINLKGELARKVRARAFIIGGEALTTSAIGYWQTQAPSIRLINEYGPTETVVGCSFYDATAQQLQSGLVPIGRPISNTELYVLDRHLQPVPIGVIGELHIGGVGVGRGYFGRPELTAQKFIPHPFKNDPQARLYRTGDRTRYLADGMIQFVGRDDDQVKIRGFRVELAEIEAALLQHSDVRTAAVNVWHDKRGNQHLVAYVIRSGTAEEDGTRELRDFLKLKLPQYMIPSSFVWLQELPLTSNGKVDKHRLPPPDSFAPVLLPKPLAMTGMEDLIAVIWKEVLGVSEIRVDDNFFDIGGHSLLLAQVQQELSQRLDRQIPIIELLQFPTIDSLAAHLTGRVEASEFQHIHNRSQKQKQALSLHNQERKAANAGRIPEKT